MNIERQKQLLSRAIIVGRAMQVYMRPLKDILDELDNPSMNEYLSLLEQNLEDIILYAREDVSDINNGTYGFVEDEDEQQQ